MARLPAHYIQPLARKCRCIPRLKQRGQSMVEFVVAAPILIGLLTAAFELSYFYGFKQHALHALQESARDAATTHLDPQQLQHSFEQHLQGWWIREGTVPPLVERQQRFLLRYQQPLYQLRILSPTLAQFRHYGTQHRYQKNGQNLPAIPTMKQREYAERSNSDDIYGANTLALDLLYLYQPLLPSTQLLLQSLRTFTHSQWPAGVIPLRIQLQYPMQSDAVLWPIPATSTVRYTQHSNQPQAESFFAPAHTTGYQQLRLLPRSPNTQAPSSPTDNPTPPTLPFPPTTTAPPYTTLPHSPTAWEGSPTTAPPTPGETPEACLIP